MVTLLYAHDERFADVIHASDDPRLAEMGLRLCLQPKAVLQRFADAALAHCAAMHLAALEA